MEQSIPLVCIKILLFADFLISRSVLSSNNPIITIYNEINFENEHANVSISKCSTLPFSRVGSIEVHGNCARLYSTASCHGTFMEILPNSPLLHVLIAWDNIADVKSAGPCSKECSKEISRFSLGDSFMVDIFEESYYKGTQRNIMVTRCTKIDDSIIHQTKSIRTNGYCVKLYNNDYCKSNGDEAKSIALGNGTALHRDLHHSWKFNVTKSISHCSFACSPEFPGKGEIIFYGQSGFEAPLWLIKDVNGNCNDKPNDMGGFINSVQIGTNTCVFLFDQNGCIGVKHVLNMSISDLSEWKQNLSINSVRECLENGTTINSIRTTSPIPLGNLTESQKMWPRIHEYTELSLAQIVVIALLGMTGLLGFGILVVFVIRKRYAYRKKPGRISEREIRDFLNGCDAEIAASSNKSEENFDAQSTELLAQNRPYNKKYDISMSRIEYDLEKPLVKEDLGVFYKGILKPITKEPNTVIESIGKPVTIKTANPSSGLHGLQSILKEVKVMLYLGKHVNIAHLENLNQGKIFVLMEFCAGGSLHSYLQNNRQSFINLVTKGRFSLDGDAKPRVQSIHLPNMTAKSREQSSFDTLLIVQWSIDVSSGMEFLSNAKIVHSDLAAKNILLTDKLQAKISDYGLSRQIYSRARYMKTQDEPWRWMAPESVKRLEFSAKSDTWSYGVLSWEMFTLGEKPYHGISYTLMLRCWEDEPTDRPTFTEISNQIQEMLEALINLIN